MPSHAGHKYLRRVTWNQVGNEKIDGNRDPERNKIKTNSAEQIPHAYPLPTGRVQATRATARVAPTIHGWGAFHSCIVGAGLAPALLLWGLPPPCYFTEPVAGSREHTRCLDRPPSRERHKDVAHRASQRIWRCCTHTSRVQPSAGCWA